MLTKSAFRCSPHQNIQPFGLASVLEYKSKFSKIVYYWTNSNIFFVYLINFRTKKKKRKFEIWKSWKKKEKNKNKMGKKLERTKLNHRQFTILGHLHHKKKTWNSLPQKRRWFNWQRQTLECLSIKLNGASNFKAEVIHK